MSMTTYHARWDEEAAYEGMRRTWGSTLNVYAEVARAGPHRNTTPLTILSLIFNLSLEVNP